MLCLPSDLIEHIASFGVLKELSFLLPLSCRRRIAVKKIQAEWRRCLPPRLKHAEVGDTVLLLGRKRAWGCLVKGVFERWMGDTRVVRVRCISEGSHLFFEEGLLVRLSS